MIVTSVFTSKLENKGKDLVNFDRIIYMNTLLYATSSDVITSNLTRKVRGQPIYDAV